MTHHLDAALAAIASVGSALFGSQVAKSIGRAVAETAPVQMPEWMQWAIGPAGALVGLVCALRWMTARLNKAEQKMEAREQERDDDKRKLIEAMIDNTATNKNTQAFISQTRDAIERLASAVNNCPTRSNHKDG